MKEKRRRRKKEEQKSVLIVGSGREKASLRCKAAPLFASSVYEAGEKFATHGVRSFTNTSVAVASDIRARKTVSFFRRASRPTAHHEGGARVKFHLARPQSPRFPIETETRASLTNLYAAKL